MWRLQRTVCSSRASASARSVTADRTDAGLLLRTGAAAGCALRGQRLKCSRRRRSHEAQRKRLKRSPAGLAEPTCGWWLGRRCPARPYYDVVVSLSRPPTPASPRHHLCKHYATANCSQASAQSSAFPQYRRVDLIKPVRLPRVPPLSLSSTHLYPLVFFVATPLRLAPAKSLTPLDYSSSRYATSLSCSLDEHNN